MRLDILHGVSDDRHVLKIIDACALILQMIIHHALIYMAQREEAESPVTNAEIMCSTGCDGIADEVMM
jgi:hypothetical protein